MLSDVQKSLYFLRTANYFLCMQGKYIYAIAQQTLIQKTRSLNRLEYNFPIDVRKKKRI